MLVKNIEGEFGKNGIGPSITSHSQPSQRAWVRDAHTTTTISYPLPSSLIFLTSTFVHHVDADVCYAKSLELRRRKYGRLSPALLPVLSSFAASLQLQNRLLEAESLLKEGLTTSPHLHRYSMDNGAI